MRNSLLLMFLTVFQVFTNDSYSQNTRLTLNLNDVTVQNVLNEIETQSEFYFLCNKKLVDTDREVSIHMEDQSIDETLSLIFYGTNVEYIVLDRQIVLSPGKYLIEAKSKLQPIIISGTVTDTDGNALPGVNIMIKGTITGMITDVDGNYRIQVQDPNAVLVFSYIGMRTQEVPVNDQASINVTFEYDAVGLDEVVAIGYGVKRKVNLSGSVSSVSAAEIAKRPVPNVQNLLQGKMPGLQVTQNSGQPGDDDAVMRIRGLGTFSGAGSDPMVLIDGVQGDLSDLNPDDIESVSILKDAASAAIYGARAANGIILVTTKKGQTGALNVDYHYNFQRHVATSQPEFVTNSADFMGYWNFANQRAGINDYFTQDDISAYRNSTDPVRYPNYDWVERCITPANTQNHHFSINGGVGGTTYNFSVGYLNQDGIVEMHDLKKFNIRFKLESKISDKITLGTNIALTTKDITEPTFTDSNIILIIYGAGPNYTPYLSDGSGRFTGRYNVAAWHNRNPVALLEGEDGKGNGNHKIKRYGVTAQSYVDVNLADGLSWKILGAINYDHDMDKLHEFPQDNFYFVDNSYACNGWPWHLGVTENSRTNVLSTFYSTLNYTRSFGDHNIHALLGYNQESNVYRYLYGYRKTFPTPDLAELHAGSADGQRTDGSASEWAIRSVLGRVNYDYSGKYLVEANFRYDGTSRIHEDNRWGFFPSVSAGWRLSQEQFLNDVAWMDNLKLRVSWGQLGNQNIGNYPYQSILSLSSYPFNTVGQGVVQTRLVDQTLSWETTTVTDIGFDISVANGLLFFTADWFNKITEDILYSIQVPMSVGLSSPTVNYASMKNTGFEFEIGHINQVGDFSYSVNFNLSAFTNEVTEVKAPTYGSETTIQEGLPWNSYYLTEVEGIFQSQAEIDGAATHPFAPLPGDLKFKDQDGNGVIDGDDRVVIDGAFPNFYYGGSLNIAWKNFDLTAFVQGVSGQKYIVTHWGIDPFMQGTPPTKDFVENMWTPDNPTNDYPAMYRQSYKPITGTKSTYHLYDASYFRVKNVMIGYNVPRNSAQKIWMKALRIYISADNLFTKTEFPGSDPERAAGGRLAIYPQLKIFTAGVKIKI